MPDYQWYHNVRRYREKNGRFVAETRIKTHVDRLARKLSDQFYVRTRSLVDDFTEDQFYEWSRTARTEISDLHNAITIIALGGKRAAQEFSTRNAQVWTAVELAIADQLGFFDRFMFGVVAGVVKIDNSMAVRAAMYPLAGYGTYENAVRIREVVAAGFNEEHRHIGSERPCDTCIREEAAGWSPIGTRRHIGDSECMSRCRCYFTYRTAPAAD